jgi:gluconate 2-dehydrogenase gamma chain
MRLLTLNSDEARMVTAIAKRLVPADESGPGATEIGVLIYSDQALAGAYHNKVETFRVGEGMNSVQYFLKVSPIFLKAAGT